MLFACSIGSKGRGENSYSIYLPMVWSGGSELNIEDSEYIGTLNNHRCVLQKHHYIYSLKVEDFRSLDECDNFISKLKMAIRWLSLKRTVGIRIPIDRSDIRVYEIPIKISEESNLKGIIDSVGWTEVDGTYNADQLVIVPEVKKLTRWETGKASILMGYNPQFILDDLNECLDLHNIDEVLSNRKLNLALELYSAYQFEVTTTGRFVKLVNVLEALLPNSQVTGESLQALKIAKKAVKEYRNAKNNMGEEIQDIEYLLGRIGNLKRQSIGINLVEFIESTLSKQPHLGTPDDMLPRIKEIYNARSTLLHTGQYDENSLRNYISILAELIPGVLRGYFGSR